MAFLDPTAAWLFGGVLLVLAIASGVGHLLKRQIDTGLNPVVIDQFNFRLRTWWLLLAVLAAAYLLHPAVTVLLFGGLSFWALREFITLTPTRLADHRALFWVFFVFTPLQYVLIGLNSSGLGNQFYGLYSVLIPVYAFLFIPARVAIAGDHKRYLERCAKIQAGLMICVYCLSHAPALLTLDFTAHAEHFTPDRNPLLLFFLVLIVALADTLQYVCERLVGRHPIAPAISASKTWEGVLGGLASSALFGSVLWWATPFNPWQAALMSAAATTMGYGGSLTMSAIKRDRGVKDYSTFVDSYGGVLDRIDSLCFAAPVFFHFARYFFA